MKKILFRGSAVALVTPFQGDGSIDFETLGHMIERQIAGGTDALVPCGTTGESATLNERERLSVIEYTVWKANGRVPVLAGTGTNSTEQSISLTRGAQRMGADGVLAVCPYYNKPTQEGLERHYTALADCSSLPVVVYDVPSRTGCRIEEETLARLSKHPNVVGLKQANGSLQSALKTRALCGEDLPLYSGDDGCILPFLAIGGLGVISVAANIFPKTIHNLCEAWFAGETDKSLALQLRLMPTVEALFSKTNPIPVKAALEKFGFGPQPLRLPLTELSPKEKETLWERLQIQMEESL